MVICAAEPNRVAPQAPRSAPPVGGRLVAEWPSGLGKGLQSPVRGFDSRFRLGRATDDHRRHRRAPESRTPHLPANRTAVSVKRAQIRPVIESGAVAMSAGLSPGASTWAVSSAGERFPDTEEVTGSIPVPPTRVSPGQ